MVRCAGKSQGGVGKRTIVRLEYTTPNRGPAPFAYWSKNMESKKSKKAPVRTRQILIRIIICLIVLLFGLLVMNRLSALKKPPAEIKRTEQALQVEGTIVKTEDIAILQATGIPMDNKLIKLSTNTITGIYSIMTF